MQKITPDKIAESFIHRSQMSFDMELDGEIFQNDALDKQTINRYVIGV